MLSEYLKCFAVVLAIDKLDGLLKCDDSREDALKVASRHLQHSANAIQVDVDDA